MLNRYETLVAELDDAYYETEEFQLQMQLDEEERRFEEQQLLEVADIRGWL